MGCEASIEILRGVDFRRLHFWGLQAVGRSAGRLERWRGEGYHCVNEFDVANQGLVSHHFRAVGGAFEEGAIPFRYVWPSELDLMARLAGMRLRKRWSGCAREPFTSDSTRHVSVWEKPASP